MLKIMQTVVAAKHTPSSPTPQRPSAKTQGRTNGPIEKGQLYIDTRGAPGAEGGRRKGHTFHQWLAYGLPPLPRKGSILHSPLLEKVGFPFFLHAPREGICYTQVGYRAEIFQNSNLRRTYS